MYFSRNRVSDTRTMSKNSASTTSSQQQLLNISEQKSRSEIIKNWLLGSLRNFCSTTALHGFNQITQRGNTTADRIFWISIVLLALITAIVLVYISSFSGRDNPTVTVIESSHYPTWNIPFPAVTICNFNKMSRTKATALAKTMLRPKNITEQQMLLIFRINMFVSFAINHTTANLTIFEDILIQNNMTVNQLADQLAPDCMEMILKCIWKGTNTRCDSLFQRIVSVEGACCSFNYFALIFPNTFPPKVAYQVPKQPYRVTGPGYARGLSILLDPFSNDYFGTYYSSYGFRLFIHDSYNYPDENAETKVVTSQRENFVRVNPETTYATNDVRQMNVNSRNCLFGNERSLNAMKRYSFINCLSECRVGMLEDRCGCMPINYLPNNATYPTCGFKQMDCIIESREIFTQALPTFDPTKSVMQSTKTFPCNCLPDCEANQYRSEITTGRLNPKHTYNRIKLTNTDTLDDNILVHIFFSDLMSTRYRKEIFQNWVSLLASFGGLLGLMMGFSIVAVCELMYFLTVRPVFNYVNN